jgi:hypothetical protein
MVMGGVGAELDEDDEGDGTVVHRVVGHKFKIDEKNAEG